MEIVILIAAILGCGGYVFYAFKKADAKALDISYMQTSSLKDAIEILDSMTASDPNYRHYTEIKVTAHGENTLTAPFSSQSAIFYSNQSFAVNQETYTTYDKDNHKHTHTRKVENELSTDVSSDPIYIQDASYTQGLYLDIQSFGSNLDLTSACDRFEQKGSPFVRTHFSYYNGGSNFLGFRLKESIIREGQPLYLLGELYRMGNDLYFGCAHQAGKTSMLSVKSEDQILNDVKKEKMQAIMFAGGILVLALVFLAR